jgi:hypothetical protein
VNVIFRATTSFVQDLRQDLSRSHRFAAERVGFVAVRAAKTDSALILFAESYYPVADDDYVDNRTVGAMMGQEAIRKALDVALLSPVGMFHVHMHEHRGRPTFSGTDEREQLKFVPDFFKVRRQLPHGAIVLSHDRASGRAWLSPVDIVAFSEFNLIGPRVSVDIVKRTHSLRPPL